MVLEKVRCADVLLRNGANTLALNRHKWNGKERGEGGRERGKEGREGRRGEGREGGGKGQLLGDGMYTQLERDRPKTIVF